MEFLKKAQERNPKLEILEVIRREGDWALVVGYLDKTDGPASYIAINTKYGLVEATTARSVEMEDMFNYVRGIDSTQTKVGRAVDLTDLMN